MSAEAIRIGARRPVRRLFVHQIRSEQLVFWRSREAAFFIFLFPLLLFVLLGSVYSGKFERVPVAWAVLAGLISYGCANTAFAGLAIQLVLRRDLHPGAGRKLVVVRVQHRIYLIIIDMKAGLFRSPRRQGSQRQHNKHKTDKVSTPRPS